MALALRQDSLLSVTGAMNGECLFKFFSYAPEFSQQ
jgi:hypothetical protein